MTNVPDCSKMEYRYLGNTGLRVSVLGWGSMMMGTDNDKNNVEAIKFLIQHGESTFSTPQKFMTLVNAKPH